MFYAKAAGKNRESKRNGGGWKADKDRSAVFSISNEKLLDSTLNFYEIIHEYIEIQVKMQFDRNRFFVATKSGDETISYYPSTLFLMQHIGHNTFFAIVRRGAVLWGHTGMGQGTTSQLRGCALLWYRFL